MALFNVIKYNENQMSSHGSTQMKSWVHGRSLSSVNPRGSFIQGW